MDISKVVYGDTTLIDLTEDTVTADSMLSGVTAHGSNGEQIYGTMSQVTPATETPLMDGTAAVGTAIKYAREDHVHPHDSTIPTKTSDLTNDSGFVAAPSANVDEVLAYNGTTWTADKRMVILSYGSSTWTDFINAYNSNAVVYCRASSNSNPASGAQTRMAFMAYVNASPPTNVEFQYYRSVSSHTDSQQGDQVFIYKLDKNSGWSVTARNAFSKVVASTGLSSSYSNGTINMSLESGYGIPSGGTTGQVLAKSSNTDRDVTWVNQSGGGGDPATADPLMDGIAAVGTSTKYAKEDHVHPVYDQIVRPNLLDNWYFVGGGSQLGDGIFPINSRGQTSYTGTGYTIDKWNFANNISTLSLNSGGITFTGQTSDYGYIGQDLSSSSALGGSTLTLSALANGVLYSSTFQYSVAGGNFTFPSGLMVYVTNNQPRVNIRIPQTTTPSETITAIKLELGGTQTLAHQVNGTWVLNELPNFEEQLLRCKTDAYRVIHPNLLDNWYFDGGGSQNGSGVFPINSRGKTTYTGSTYTIDRWRTWDGGSTLTLNSGYITFSTGSNGDGLFQYMPNIWQFQNKTFTVSALMDGKIYSVTGKTTSTGWIARNIDNDGSYIAFVLTSSEANFRIILAPNKTVNIRAVKLELGTAQTLGREETDTVGVLNELPNYEEQLIRCRTSPVSAYNDYYTGNVLSYNAPNPNLLDNWYFVGGGSQQGGGQFPINQRGKTSYSGSGYCVDRWKAYSQDVSFSVQSGYVTLTATGQNTSYFGQIASAATMADINGKNLTISVLTSTGQLFTGTGIGGTQFSISTSFGWIYHYPTNNELFDFSMNAGSSVNIVAVKAELGTTQTLAHQENGIWVLNEIPNYEEQLLRCKTDAYRITNPNLLRNWYFVGGGSQQGSGIFPINSRGSSWYNDPQYVYDGWYTETTGVKVNLNADNLWFYSGGVNNAQFRQLVDNSQLVDGETYTMSVLVSNITSGGQFNMLLGGRTTPWPSLGNVNVTSTGLTTSTFTFSRGSYTGQYKFILASRGTAEQALKIKAVKLEKGTTQTLAHQENGVWVLNELPNFEEQLILCKTATVDSGDNYANNVLSYNTPNPNLLDNWCFVGGGSQQGGGQFPINQRGQTTYIGNTIGIDRWFGEDARSRVTVNSNSVTFSEASGSSWSVFIQLFEQNTVNMLLGKIATLSILTTTGLYSRTFTFPTDTSTNYNSPNLEIASGVVASVSLFFSAGSYQACRITATDGGSVSLVAAKLELGSTQTLAHQEKGAWVLNEIPNYEEQLLRCGAATPVLYFTGVTCTATTGNFVNYSNSAITANHVLLDVQYARPDYITSDVTWTTTAGNIQLNGTCKTATTCYLILGLKQS